LFAGNGWEDSDSLDSGKSKNKKKRGGFAVACAWRMACSLRASRGQAICLPPENAAVKAMWV
jgi:hypothetical protein